MSQSGERTVIVIVDDHPVVRGAMRQVLGGADDTVEVIEAPDFNRLQSVLKDRGDIDLVMLDLAMPGTSGLSGLLTLRADHAAVPVIIVSATEDTATIRRSMELGASGFVPKSAGIETIREAVSTVLRGDLWQPEDIELGQETDAETADLLERLDTLTPQQKRVLSMIGQGLLNKQIAYELSVSEATVKAHVSAVLQKLDVDSRTQAVIRLSRLGSDALTSTGL